MKRNTYTDVYDTVTDTHRQTERHGLWHWGKSDGRQRREGRNRERRNIEKTCAVMPDCFAHSSLLQSHKENTSQTATNCIFSSNGILT